LQVSEQTSRVNQPIANAHNSAPGKKSVTHFVAWLQELNEVWRGGMMSDEDYAFSKAEHLEHLLEPLKRPWRKWIFGVLPVVLIAGGVVSYFEQSLDNMLTAACVGAVCVVGAIVAHWQAVRGQLSKADRLTVIRELLARDLITCDEFGVFEQRILSMP
jgi:hypothetical protein